MARKAQGSTAPPWPICEPPGRRRVITVHLSPWRAAPALLPPGVGVYAIGDIHGQGDLLDRLLAAIAVDRSLAAPGRRDYLVGLGDYVDRGPVSRQVIERLSTLSLPGLEVCCLGGNHEEMMRGFLDSPVNGRFWLVNGGRETLDSYGIDPPDPIDSVAVAAAAAALRTHLPARHRAFLAALPDQMVLGGYLFVHAGLRPGVDPAAQDPRDLRWIRDEFLFSEADHGVVVVHGHTIVAAPDFRRNRIGIDTGAYASGRLTCLILEADRCRTLATARLPEGHQ